MDGMNCLLASLLVSTQLFCVKGALFMYRIRRGSVWVPGGKREAGKEAGKEVGQPQRPYHGCDSELRRPYGPYHGCDSEVGKPRHFRRSWRIT